MRTTRDQLIGGATKRGLRHLASPRSGHRRSADPLRTLREFLEVARASGMDFDSAWEPSVQGALTGYRGLVRNDWTCAMRETREVWRSAYVGEPNGRLERWAGVLHTSDTGAPLGASRGAASTSVEAAASRSLLQAV
jgi:hypothetical protein